MHNTHPLLNALDMSSLAAGLPTFLRKPVTVDDSSIKELRTLTSHHITTIPISALRHRVAD